MEKGRNFFCFFGKKKGKRGGERRIFWEKGESAMWFFSRKNFLLISKYTPLQGLNFKQNSIYNTILYILFVD